REGRRGGGGNGTRRLGKKPSLATKRASAGVAPKGEGRLDFAAGAGVEHSNLQSEGACRFRYISQRGFGNRSIRGIDQYSDTNCLGQQIMQEAKPLGHNLSGEGIDAGRIAAWPGKACDQPQLDRVIADGKTIGIVEVAAVAASAPKREAGVAITATRRRMSSSMSDGKRLYWPSSQWYSTITFCPST